MMMENLTIGVIGLRVAGLSIAANFAKHFPVLIYDLEEEFNGDPHLSEQHYNMPDDSRMEILDSPERLTEAGILIVAVPAFISVSKHPELTLLLKACEVAGLHMKKGVVIIITAAVYPGATEEKCIPVLERTSGMEAGKQFFVGYSPSAVEEESETKSDRRSLKIIAGQNNSVLDYIEEVFTAVYGNRLYKAESIRVAEAAELVSTIQRMANVALMNELAAILKLLDIDTQDVLRAAATKKDSLKFQPGFSGNHEKSRDSYQLTHRALAVGYHPEIILSALRVNEGIGHAIANSIIKEMNQLNLPLQSTAIAVIGVTNEEDSPVIEKSKVFDMIEKLKEFGLKIQVADNMADPELVERQFGIRLTPWKELSPAAAVVLAVPHKEVREGGWQPVQKLLKEGKGIVFDIKSVLDKKRKPENLELWRL